MNKTLISVIVPVFNAEKYIEKCLASLLQQTDLKFEILLIDDGSQDRSPDLCDAAQLSDSRVRVFHLENHGVSFARNYGIDYAGGEYISFLDADDWLEHDALQKMRQAMEENDADLVVGDYARFRDGEMQDYCVNCASGKSLLVLNGPKGIAQLFFNPATNLHGVAVWGKLYRKSLIDEKHIRFPEEISYEEDCCFNVQYDRYIRKAVLLGDVVYHYRQTTCSLSKGYRREGFHFLMQGYRERSAFIREIGLAEKQSRLDIIMGLVVRNNCLKIAMSDLSCWEKIAEYREMLTEPELKVIATSVNFPRTSFNGLLMHACRDNNPLRIYLLAMLHTLIHHIKQLLGR